MGPVGLNSSDGPKASDGFGTALWYPMGNPHPCREGQGCGHHALEPQHECQHLGDSVTLSLSAPTMEVPSLMSPVHGTLYPL